MRMRVWLGVVAAVAIAASCSKENKVDAGDDVASVGQQCGGTDDIGCGEGSICVLGFCRHGCTTDAECSDGALCLGDREPYGCSTADELACSDDEPCGRPLVCGLDGKCRLPCDGNCPRNEHHCLAGTCVSQGEQGTEAWFSCPDGQLQCDETYTEVWGCNVSQPGEALQQECPLACVDGVCGGECRPAEEECEGTTRNVCNNRGEWTAQPGGCQCDTPGDTTCQGNAVATCEDDGYWGDPSDCVDSTCVDGECIGVCEPTGTQCEGELVQSCDPVGAWGAAEHCPAQGQSCIGGGCANDPSLSVLDIYALGYTDQQPLGAGIEVCLHGATPPNCVQTTDEGLTQIAVPVGEAFTLVASGSPAGYRPHLTAIGPGFAEDSLGVVLFSELEVMMMFAAAGLTDDPSRGQIVSSAGDPGAAQGAVGATVSITPASGDGVTYINATGAPDPTLTAVSTLGTFVVTNVEPGYVDLAVSGYTVPCTSPNGVPGEVVPDSASVPVEAGSLTFAALFECDSG